MVPGELKKNFEFGGQRGQRNNFGAHGGTKNYKSSVNTVRHKPGTRRMKRKYLDFKIYIPLIIPLKFRCRLQSKRTTMFAIPRALRAIHFRIGVSITAELNKKIINGLLYFKREQFSQKLGCIRIPRVSDLKRNAKRRQNRIDFVRTSIYPLQRFRSSIRNFVFKGKRGLAR